VVICPTRYHNQMMDARQPVESVGNFEFFG